MRVTVDSCTQRTPHYSSSLVGKRSTAPWRPETRWRPVDCKQGLCSSRVMREAAHFHGTPGTRESSPRGKIKGTADGPTSLRVLASRLQLFIVEQSPLEFQECLGSSPSCLKSCGRSTRRVRAAVAQRNARVLAGDQPLTRAAPAVQPQRERSIRRLEVGPPPLLGQANGVSNLHG